MPFLLARRMLDDAGFEAEEHLLSSREQVDAFKDEHGGGATPQTSIGGRRIAAVSLLLIWRACIRTEVERASGNRVDAC